MNEFLTQVNSSFRSFAQDEEGAQIIEYALIVAVVSLGLIAAMTTLVDTDFQGWIAKVGGLLNPTP